MCEFCMSTANGGSEGEFNQFSGLYGITPIILLFLISLLWFIRIYLESYLQNNKDKKLN